MPRDLGFELAGMVLSEEKCPRMYPAGINTDMMTFQEFLHSHDWKKPLFPRDDKVVRKIIRSGQQDASRTWQTAPPHQLLMLALGRAGQRGLSRAEISGLVALDNQTLDELLDALVRSTEIGVAQRQDGQRVYRRLL